jgi:hypothetical protein
MHARRLEALAKWHFSFLGAEHCVAREVYDDDGNRIFSHPMWSRWANSQFSQIREMDPVGLLLPLALASDKTDLSPEQSAEPLYVVSNALPLEEMRKRRHWPLAAYFSSLPPAVVAKLSNSKLLELRKELLRLGLRAIFSKYSGKTGDNPGLLGRQYRDARGILQSVHVRFQNVRLDYPVIAAWTLTLANQACFRCRRRAGEFHIVHPASSALRWVARERAVVEEALTKQSKKAQQDFARQYGLHPIRNDGLWDVTGLDIYQGVTISPLHVIYHGHFPLFVELTFDSIQKQVTKAAFNALGNKIDVYITSTVATTPFIKTSFNRGLSHYFHSALAKDGSAWQSSIKFGKITSKETMRDVMRFWRLLLIDLTPECPELMELFTTYFDWKELVERLAHTSSSLDEAMKLYKEWAAIAVRLFGKEQFWNRIKFHIPEHLKEIVEDMMAVPYSDDAPAETAHIEGAKEPWEHTNGRNIQPTMTNYVARRDMLRLLREFAATSSSPLPTAPLPAQPFAETASVLSNVLMTSKTVKRISLTEVKQLNPQLEQLYFSVRLFLRLASGW